jgi:hypothetical protein
VRNELPEGLVLDEAESPDGPLELVALQEIETSCGTIAESKDSDPLDLDAETVAGLRQLGQRFASPSS